MMKYSTFAAVTVLTAFILGACGVKTSPVPPEGGHPNVVTDLAARAREDGILLRWKAPKTSRKGKFTEPAGFEIQRRAKAAKEAAWSEYETVAEINYNKTIETVTWKDTNVNPDVRYEYRLASVDESGDMGPYSETVTAKWDIPPGKPTGLTAETGNRTVTLMWNSPEKEGGPKIEGYYIYRAKGEAEAKLATPYAVPETEFFDGGLENGVEYRYLVRAATASGNFMIEGPASETVRTVPGDKIAPAAPVGVGAFLLEDGVKVMWWPNEEDDLSGYHVYRKHDGQTEKVTEELLKEPGYMDSAARRNQTYTYTVTAVDDSGNESPRSEASKIYVK